jgi:transcriptional regulator with GAF, ATPase, and Fis domain
VKGAFTGADRDREGKFAAAGRGTLLLDEIDVLPPEQQAKLLRVIETGEYEPVGSNETQHSQARLVVASNYNLE